MPSNCCKHKAAQASPGQAKLSQDEEPRQVERS